MQWLEDGLKHIWLPYTQMKQRPSPLLPIKSAKGCRLILSDNNELIDGISSWWSVCHGYSHPHIVETMVKQLNTLSHVMFAGCAHEPAYTLATRLTKLFNYKLSRVFFSDSGSTAVEIALKIAIQYFRNLGQAQKNKFVSFNNAYHGDTAGCMSISSTCVQGETFKQHISNQYMVPISQNLDAFKDIIRCHHKNIAGVIIEPILQAAGGMKIHNAETLKEIYQITKEHNILFIADEIATGFYRLGQLFACDFANITPDIITLGKALTGGMCSLGATITTQEIFKAFLSDHLENALMHGPTFMANPIACSAANASLDLFERDNYVDKVRLIEQQLKCGLEHCIKYDKVIDVRIKGAMAAIEVQANWNKICELRQKSVELGVWLRPLMPVIYLMPPFVISENELSKLIYATISLVQSL